MAADDFLRKNAELVANAVAHARVAQRRHRIQEASRQATEATVAEASVRLYLQQVLQRDAQFRQRLAGRVHQPQGQEVVSKRTSQQVLGAEVADALHVSLMVGALGRHPSFRQPVAHCHGDGHEAVQRRRGAPPLGSRVADVGQEATLKMPRVVLESRRLGD